MVATSWTRVMLNVPVKVMEVGVVMLRNVVSYQPAGVPLSVGDVLHSTSVLVSAEHTQSQSSCGLFEPGCCDYLKNGRGQYVIHGVPPY